MLLKDKELLKTPGLLEYLESFMTPRRKELIEKVLAERTKYLTVVLEDVWHSQNSSAVLRSCECFGVQEVNIVENAAKFQAKTNVVQGASKWVNVHRYNEREVNNTKTCFDSFRRNGYQIIATTLRKEKYTPLNEIPLDKKLAVCFGCEETGLSDYVHEEADHFVQLPMYGFTESFNISVSVALVLQILCERLRASGMDIYLTEQEKDELRMNWVQKSIKNSDLLINRYLNDNNLS